MFGYVRPLRCQLRLCEDELYKAAYCGLCHAMARRHNWLARYLLDYDLAFLALGLSAGQMPDEKLLRRRCPAHPFKRIPVCHPTAAFDAAADDSLLLTVWKLRDNVEDSGFVKGLPSRVLARLFRKPFARAARYRPRFAALVEQELGRLSALEREGVPSLDRPADAFARLMAGMAEGAPEERILSPVLYHTGRWIYLVDAVDDLPRDVTEGRYNPVALRFNLSDGTLTPEAREALTATLALSRATMADALNLLPDDAVRPILLNIAELGLSTVERQVIDGTWRKRNKADNGKLKVKEKKG